jgi:RimJ/RimL family protein N-acetyltransferase
MLDLAMNHKDELQKLFRETYHNPKYKYYNGSYHEDRDYGSSTWSHHDFASIHDGKVIGFIGYMVDREVRGVYNFGIINFSDKKAVFGIDVLQIFDDIFYKFNFTRAEWRVNCGNPIERSYDKLAERMGGRIIGISTKCSMLFTGEICDSKSYEILREDYMKARERGGRKCQDGEIRRFRLETV